MAPHAPDLSGPLLAGPLLSAPLLVAMTAAVVVTPVLSLLVLWYYRRAVDRSMRASARRGMVAVPPAAPVPAGGPDRPHRRARPVPVVVLDERHRAGGSAATGTGDDLWQRARRRLHGTVAVYVVAGLVSGLVLAAVRLAVTGTPVDPHTLLVLTVLLAWPLVPTVLALVAAGRPALIPAWGGYAVLLLLASAGTGMTLSGLATLVGLFVGPPAVLLLALTSRPVRAVGPFLAVPVLLTAVGLLMAPDTAVWAQGLGASTDVSGVVGVLVAGLLGLAGFAHLARAARRYARKRAGDQMLTIGQWWFLAAAWQSVTLLPYGIGAALAALAAYPAFRIVLAVGLRLRPRPAGPPRRLLLLRTFGASRRSEILLRRLGARWRHVGTITMIAGPDLVAAALEPHDFLDLLRGRLDRRFVGSPGELRDRLAELDDRPDPDGRYRVGELFCHDDLWRPALQALLRHTDCVLLDARGFGRQHEGVTWEITQLLQLVPLDRVLVLVDHTTDEYFLRATLDRARLDALPYPAVAESRSLRLLRTHSRHLDPAVVVEHLGRVRG